MCNDSYYNKNIVRTFARNNGIIRGTIKQLYKYINPFPGTDTYWERRYAAGGNSGGGSFGHLAEFKANVLNTLVSDKKIRTVIEFGCGDGNQLSLYGFPQYTGFDVSESALQRCRTRFAGDATKTFLPLFSYSDHVCDLSISIDVIFHLLEDEKYNQHMEYLFRSSEKYVAIYSSNKVDDRHFQNFIRHRLFTEWVVINRPDFKMIDHVRNPYPFKGNRETGSVSDFFIYERI